MDVHPAAAGEGCAWYTSCAVDVYGWKDAEPEPWADHPSGVGIIWRASGRGADLEAPMMTFPLTSARAALWVLALTVCSGTALAGQSATTPHPRLDASVGITSMRLRKLPADSRVGGEPIGVFASVGYFWTSSLVTEFETASQAESWNPDYALEYVARLIADGRYSLQSVQLKRGYTTGRWTVAQLFQLRRLRFFQPYFGVGAGRQTQTITDSREESTPYLTETLPPNAKTVDELPTEFPSPSRTRSSIGFAEVGLKIFAGRRAYFAVDWRFVSSERALVSVGFGVELF